MSFQYSIKEEIARSHQTVDNDPIQYDEHPEVDVEMYANDMGTWSVKVSCVSNPSLSFPMQKFPDEYSANHYARNCADQIVRKTMNESKKLQEKYSLRNAFYEDDLILTEGLLSWIKGLIGKFAKVYFGEADKSTKSATNIADKALNSSLLQTYSKKILGKEVDKFEDLDLEKNEGRKVYFETLCHADDKMWTGQIQNLIKSYKVLSSVQNWFPPEDEKEAEKWTDDDGTKISNGLYAYLGWTLGASECIGEHLGGNTAKVNQAYSADKEEIIGSTLKAVKFLQEQSEPALLESFKYASETLESKNAKNMFDYMKLAAEYTADIALVIEKATKEKADKDFEGDLSGELEGMDVEGEEKKKKTDEAKIRSIVADILLEFNS